MFGQYHYEHYVEYVQHERIEEARRGRQVREFQANRDGSKQRRFGGEELNRAVSALRLVFSR